MEDLQRLRDEYESALDEVERRRAAYHQEIRKLHMGGMPLRDIADALGISHQRVHQIVGADEPVKKRSVRRLVGGAGVVLLLGVLGFGGWAWRVEAGREPALWRAPDPLRFTVFLKPGVPEARVAGLIEQVEHHRWVTGVRHLSPDQFLAVARCYWERGGPGLGEPEPLGGMSAVIVATAEPADGSRVVTITAGNRDIIERLQPGFDYAVRCDPSALGEGSPSESLSAVAG